MVVVYTHKMCGCQRRLDMLLIDHVVYIFVDSFQYIFIWISLITVFSDVIRSSGKCYSSINRSSEADSNNVACPIQPVYTLSSMSC